MNGCTVEILNLTINPQNTFTTTASTSGSYTWVINGATYTSSGVYTYTATNGGGCTDTYVLNLTITSTLSLTGTVFLQGAYDVTTGLMSDSLRIQGNIPLVEPYTASPYNKPVIGAPALEAVPASVLSITGSQAIVDWIFIEMRSASNPSTILATKRALLRRDGTIVSHTDGVSPVSFSSLGNGNYFVSVKHRNHLGVMSANPLAMITGTPSTVNFAVAGSVYVYPTIMNAPRKLVGSVYTLWSGDANTNKNVKYNGLMNDKDPILVAVGGPASINSTTYGYRAEDLNMDGKVRYNNADNDRVVIINNVGVNTPNKVISQHTPN